MRRINLQLLIVGVRHIRTEAFLRLFVSFTHKTNKKKFFFSSPDFLAMSKKKLKRTYNKIFSKYFEKGKMKSSRNECNRNNVLKYD